MARRRGKKSRRGGSKKIPLGATGAMAVMVYGGVKGYQAGQIPGAILGATGFDVRAGKFTAPQNILGPAVLIGVSMAASKLGVNRYLSKVPFVKI